MSLDRLAPPVRAGVRALLLALALAGTCGAHAQSGADAPWWVLAPRVNSEAKPALFVRRTASGEILLRREDLPALGFRDIPAASRQIEGEAFVPLSALAGVQSRLDPSTLELELLVPPALLERTVQAPVDREQQLERVGADSGFLNWALDHDTAAPARPWHMASELGLRKGPWLLQSGGQTVDGGDSQRFVRLASTALRDDPPRQQRWMVGDFFFTAMELGSGANLGGISLSRVLTLDPYRPHSPPNTLSGQLLYPSEVDIYVDGQRVRSQRLPPGEFQIDDLLLGQGARDVQLVARDPYGRVQQFDYALYATEQLLAPGTDEYQYALGALRRNYGLRSADYGPLAVAFRHRWGLHPGLTLGLQGQARSGLANAGFTGTLRLARHAGLLSGSWAGSRAEGVDGHAAALRYSYATRAWSLGAAWQQRSPGYAVLSEPRSLDTRRQTRSVFVSRSWAGIGTLSFTHTRQTRYAAETVPLPAGYTLTEQPPRRSDTLAYSTYLQNARSYLQLSAGRMQDERGARTEVALLLTFFLDGSHLLSVSGRRDADLGGSTLELSHAPPIGEGWGYQLGADQAGQGPEASRQWYGSAQYNARHAVLRGDWRQPSGDSPAGGLRLAASGGIGWVDGEAFLSRPISDSFAVAKVGELAGVPVKLNGQPMGETDAHGELFIPAISAFYEAQLSLDDSRIPIDYAVPRLSRSVVLPARSGAVVAFEATRVRAVLARLVRTAPGPQLDGSPVHLPLGAREIDTVVGSDSELYLENLPLGHHRGTVGSGDNRCVFDVEVPATGALITALGDVPCRAANAP